MRSGISWCRSPVSVARGESLSPKRSHDSADHPQRSRPWASGCAARGAGKRLPRWWRCTTATRLGFMFCDGPPIPHSAIRQIIHLGSLGQRPGAYMAAAMVKRWFSKIETTDQALQVIKDTSNVFFVLAAIQAAGSFLVGYSIL